MSGPRIGLCGVILESNRSSPVATREDFESLYVLEGEPIVEAARAPRSVIAPEMSAFVQMMDVTGGWTPVPLLFAGCHPHGPVDGALMREFTARTVAGIEAAAQPLDAVFIANHGAMVATDSHDPDGDYCAAVRAALGPDKPIIITLDLHGNISDQMAAAVDMIVGYRTNPHVDMIERGEEAASAMRMVLAGRTRPQLVVTRLPLTPASVALLTADAPYGTMIDYGQRRQAEHAGAILNVSIFGGFVFSDTPDNGVAVCVTAREDREVAKRLADEIAAIGWSNRGKFRRRLMPIPDAIELTQKADRKPVIFADSGDNPGGGGTGRTSEFLEALLAASPAPEGVYYGSFYDPPLAEAAHRAGLGATFTAELNNAPGTPYDRPVMFEAQVVGLNDGDVVGRLGLFAGRTMKLGKAAALKTGGITIIVISDRTQTADPMFFEVFGLDIADAQTVVVKSRGHFRAGFRPWFAPEQVFELDTEGLTSPVLERRQWQYLPRPVYPLDEDATWEPAA
jgi:microcystin degradation protein MlrC